jgi:uncharacterized membrane protein YdjX (TVP38/TMEM64 family)
MLGHELELHLPDIENWVHSLGHWASVGFIGSFVILAPLFVSVDALCFAAGVLFPLLSGWLYIIIATYLAAGLIFGLGRYVVQEKVARLIAKHKKFAVLDAALGKQAFKIMLLLRLTPLPFALLSYVFAIAPVPFWPYLAATSGILIYNLTLVYIGYTTKHMAGLVTGASMQTPISYPLLVAGLLFTLGVIGYLSKYAAKILKDMHIDNSEESNY